MKRKTMNHCKSISDKDFIFDVFQNKGFVPNAHSFLQTGLNNDFTEPDQDSEDLNSQDTQK